MGGYHRTFSSIKVNPLPALVRRLYLIVGHRTTGRSLSTGRGATAEALATRACRLRCFRPAWMDRVSTSARLMKQTEYPVLGRNVLELDAANLCESLLFGQTLCFNGRLRKGSCYGCSGSADCA